MKKTLICTKNLFRDDDGTYHFTDGTGYNSILTIENKFIFVDNYDATHHISGEYMKYFVSPDEYEHVKNLDVQTELVEALEKFTEMYTELINSGDCGNWAPEDEEEVIAARKAIKRAKDSINQNQ